MFEGRPQQSEKRSEGLERKDKSKTFEGSVKL
jgi:hypothetical protein